MRPFTFMERMWFLLQAPFRWIQCMHTRPCPWSRSDYSVEYCIRCKGHFGAHSYESDKYFATAGANHE